MSTNIAKDRKALSHLIGCSCILTSACEAGVQVQRHSEDRTASCGKGDTLCSLQSEGWASVRHSILSNHSMYAFVCWEVCNPCRGPNSLSDLLQGCNPVSRAAATLLNTEEGGIMSSKIGLAGRSCQISSLIISYNKSRTPCCQPQYPNVFLQLQYLRCVDFAPKAAVHLFPPRY